MTALLLGRNACTRSFGGVRSAPGCMYCAPRIGIVSLGFATKMVVTALYAGRIGMSIGRPARDAASILRRALAFSIRFCPGIWCAATGRRDDRAERQTTGDLLACLYCAPKRQAPLVALSGALTRQGTGIG